MSIKVAVRVRPFSDRERKLNSQLCVQMDGNTTKLINENGNVRRFAFDHSFWSHDEFDEDEEGILRATSDKYADQEFVYENVGREILENAWKGYHCCLFAYGQTGSGKSYSMIGYGKNRGIVPKAAQEIFSRIEEEAGDEIMREVTVSMLEIYNEKVHDLLMPGGLKVRENKTMGVYVQDLSKWPVVSFKGIAKKIEEGNRNRTIASTRMNTHSSRAHTIISIELRQINTKIKNGKGKHSIIYLVDLAGSEKVGKTGARGDRLKESCSINRSLSTLGMVISALADRETGKKVLRIPYRDGVLTRILQNALGGNSKTLMLCAISPAMDNYDETLSTLRYADQAKKIKCHAKVNESETDKLIRELKEENDRLKRQLEMMGEESDGKKEIEEQFISNQGLIDGMMKTFEERLIEMREKLGADDDTIYDYSAPHLININEDPLLNGKIFFNLLAIPILYVGRKNGKPKPHIILNIAGIKSKHARIMNNDGRIFLLPQNSKCKYIYINGKKITKKQELKHLDRIVFGMSSFFLFRYPGHENETNSEDMVEKNLDWEFFRNELAVENDEFIDKTQINLEDVKGKYEKEFEQAKKKIEEEMQKQRNDYENKIKELSKKFNSVSTTSTTNTPTSTTPTTPDNSNLPQMSDLLGEYMKKIQDEQNEKEKEFEEQRQEILRIEKIMKRRQIIKNRLTKNLLELGVMIEESNLISKELKKNIRFSIDFSPGYYDEHLFEDVTDFIRVRVDNFENNVQYKWDYEKFSNRYYLFQEELEAFFEKKKKESEIDPFWDPHEFNDVARAYIIVKPLVYFFDNEIKAKIFHENFEVGFVRLRVEPCKVSGEFIHEEEVDDFTSPNNLLEKPFYFNVLISEAEIDPTLTRKCFIQYHINDGKRNAENYYYKTEVVSSNSGIVDFNYKMTHCIENLDKSMLVHMTIAKLEFEFFAYYGLENYLKFRKNLDIMSNNDIKIAIQEKENKEITKFTT